jgi:hypothetical protein
MRGVPAARPALPAVAGRRLSEGLGHTEVRSIFGMVQMLPELKALEKATALALGMWRDCSTAMSIRFF